MGNWQLEFEFHDPQRISIRLPGDQESTTFWYIVYQVTNNTGKDVEFYPSFRLVTDTLQVVEGGSEISPTAYQVIAAQHKTEFPFLAEPQKITGRLLQGESNARASVVAFREFDREASSFVVYVSGLSGEVARVGNPAFDTRQPESEENERFFLFRRTLAIAYLLPGDWITSTEAVPLRRTREWIMR